MAATWQDVMNILGLRRGRKQAASDRLLNAATTYGNRKFAAGESGKQRELTASEGSLDRASRKELTDAQLAGNLTIQELLGTQAESQIGQKGAETRATNAAGYEAQGTLQGQAEAARTALQEIIDQAAGERTDAQVSGAYARQELVGTQAESQIGKRGIEDRLTNAAGYDAQGELQGQAEAARERLQGLIDKAAGERGVAASTARMNEIRELYRESYQNYDIPMPVRNPVTGEEIQIRNAGELSAFLDSFAQQAAQKWQEALARLSDQGQPWLTAVNEAKDAILNPSVFDPETGAWRATTDTTPEELIAGFVRVFKNSGDWTDGQALDAEAFFRSFVEDIQPAEPDAESDAESAQPPARTGPFRINYEPGSTADLLSNQGFLGQAVAPLVKFGESLAGPITMGEGYPTGSPAEVVNRGGVLGQAAAPIVNIFDWLSSNSASMDVATKNLDGIDTTGGIDAAERSAYAQLVSLLRDGPENRDDILATLRTIETRDVDEQTLQAMIDRLLGPAQRRTR